MPHNPGVQSTAGQSYAHGILAAGQGLASGIQDAARIYSQNKLMAGQAIGKFEGALKADPELQQYLNDPSAPPEAAKAYKKLMKDGTVGVRDAAMLAQFAETYTQHKQEQQMGALRRAQADLAQGQVRQMGEQERQMQQLRQYAQYSGGVGTGVLQPGVQDAMKQNMAQNPYLQQAAQLAQATGRAPQPDDLIRMQTAAKPAKEALVVQNLGDGVRAAMSPSTGAFSILPQTAQQVAATEGAKVEAELSAKGAASLLGEISDGAESARNTVGGIERILSLYGEGAQSGFGQPVLTQMQAALGRLGYGREQLATQQQLEKELQAVALEYRRDVTKGTGQVSDYESKQIERAVANIGNTPDANVRILGVLKNVKERTIKLDELREKLESEGKSKVEIARQVRAARASMPIGLEALGAGSSGPAAAGQGWTADKEKRLEELRRRLGK